MVKGYVAFALLIASTICIKDILADCSCDGVCEGLEAFDRAACIDDGVEGETNECNNYCECGAGGAATIMECPDFLGYDPSTKSCTWQNDVETCGNTTQPTTDIPECDETQCTAPEVYNPLIRQCVPEGTYVCGDAMPKCTVGSIYDKKYVVDKTNCSGYYYCSGNVRLKGSCDANLYYFNPIKQICTYKSSLNCTVPGTSESGPTPGIDWENICNGVVSKFIPDPRVCKAYIYCNAESQPRQAFCAGGKFFSNGQCVSTAPSSCTCEIHDFTEEITEDDVKYAGSTDPKKFFLCSKGQRSEEECLPGTAWNQQYESCVFA